MSSGVKIMKNMKYGIPFAITLACVMLFSVCDTITDTPKIHKPVKNNYGRISISFTNEGADPQSARTVLPSTAFDKYVYTFTKMQTQARQVKIDMYDSAGDGWDGNGALRINVNGIQIATNIKVQSGSTNTYTFNVTTGDVVQLYWVAGSAQSENSFIVYYTDTPPSPAFTTSNNNSWNGTNALVYKSRGTMSSISGGALLGSFTGVGSLTDSETTGVEQEPDDDGFFTLEVGNYTVEVQAFTGDEEPCTLAASGISSSFSVGSGSNAQVLVPLLMVTAEGNGKFSYTITYPAGAAAKITLQKWSELLDDIPLNPVNVSRGNGKTQTLELEAGSYLFTVLVNKNNLFAGLNEAVHIYPANTTVYTKDFGDSDLLAYIPITSAEIIVSAPVKNAIPDTTASGTGYFTTGAVSWIPENNPFLDNTVYTARVMLTANNFYTFTGLSSASINGQNAVVSDNTGANVTLSYTFPATSNKTVIGMEIKTQPTTLTYTHSDPLDLTGLVVTLTYEDSTTEDIAAASFTAKNITTNPAQGNNLIRSTHNGQPVIIAYGSLTSLETDNLTVDPKIITFTVDPIPAQTYTGSEIRPAVTVKDNTTTPVTTLTPDADYTVKYSNNINAGTATVTITGAGNYAGSTDYSTAFIVNKATPIAGNFTFSGTTSTYDGTAKTVIITPKENMSTGAITVLYNGNSTAPVNAGTYPVTFNVAAAANWNAATGLSAGNIVINKATGATVSGAPTVSTRTQNSITVNAVTVTAPTNGQTVEYARSTSSSTPSTGWQSGTSFTGLSASTTYYIFARAKEVANYNAGTASSLSVTTLHTYTVTANGSFDATTTALTFTFTGNPGTISASNITLGGNASKGSATLSDSGATRTLSPITLTGANIGSATVSISHADIETGSKNVTVFNISTPPFPLAFSTTVQGFIEANTVNRYKVILAQPGKLSVSLTSPGGTTALPSNGADVKWFNDKGTEISGKGTSTGLSFPYSDSADLAAGTYYIGIIGRSGAGNTGFYNIRADYYKSEVEPNNTTSNAQLLVPGLTVGGEITSSDTTDMFKYVLTEPGRLTMNVTRDTIDEMSVQWYDTNGAELKSARYYWLYSPSSEYMDLEVGTYYIKIVQYNSSTGRYTLCGDFTAAGNDETEPNNTTSNAQLVTSGQTVKGFISHQDTTDMYKYVLAQPGRLTMNVTRDTIDEMSVQWYDTNGAELKSARYYWLYSPSSEYMDLEVGTYYIKIVQYNSSTGRYTLCGDFTAAGNNETEPNNVRNDVNVQQLTSGQTVKGLISYKDDTDMYRIVLTQSKKVTLNVTRDTIDGMFVRWYDANGAELKSACYYWLYSPSSEYMDLEVGTYYIGIVQYNSSTGTYSLKVTW